MSRSEPKPRIIYKNLEEIIRRSNMGRASSSKKSLTQAAANARKPMTDISNKHQTIDSLEKRKTKFIQKMKTNDYDKLAVADLYGNHFIEIDAIFTDLEDFLLQVKEKVLKEIRSCLKIEGKGRNLTQAPQSRIDEMKKMSEYVKHISNYFINDQIPNFENIKTESVVHQSCPSSKFHTTGVQTEKCEIEADRMVELSMKSSKARANRRGEAANYRKKTIYELILEEQQRGAKGTNYIGTSVALNGYDR